MALAHSSITPKPEERAAALTIALKTVGPQTARKIDFKKNDSVVRAFLSVDPQKEGAKNKALAIIAASVSGMALDGINFDDPETVELYLSLGIEVDPSTATPVVAPSPEAKAPDKEAAAAVPPEAAAVGRKMSAQAQAKAQEEIRQASELRKVQSLSAAALFDWVAGLSFREFEALSDASRMALATRSIELEKEIIPRVTAILESGQADASTRAKALLRAIVEGPVNYISIINKSFQEAKADGSKRVGIIIQELQDAIAAKEEATRLASKSQDLVIDSVPAGKELLRKLRIELNGVLYLTRMVEQAGFDAHFQQAINAGKIPHPEAALKWVQGVVKSLLESEIKQLAAYQLGKRRDEAELPKAAVECKDDILKSFSDAPESLAYRLLAAGATDPAAAVGGFRDYLNGTWKILTAAPVVVSAVADSKEAKLPTAPTAKSIVSASDNVRQKQAQVAELKARAEAAKTDSGSWFGRFLNSVKSKPAPVAAPSSEEVTPAPSAKPKPAHSSIAVAITTASVAEQERLTAKLAALRAKAEAEGQRSLAAAANGAGAGSTSAAEATFSSTATESEPVLIKMPTPGS